MKERRAERPVLKRIQSALQRVLDCLRNGEVWRPGSEGFDAEMSRMLDLMQQGFLEPAGIAPRFPLGQILIPSEAPHALKPAEIAFAIRSHALGDWGLVSAEQRRSNEFSVTHQRPIFSEYNALNGFRFFVVTEADRSATWVVMESIPA